MPMIPARVNFSKSGNMMQETSAEIGFSSFFRNQRCLIAIVLYFTSLLCLVFLDPILGIRLVDLGIDEKNVGFAYSIMAVA